MKIEKKKTENQDEMKPVLVETDIFMLFKTPERINKALWSLIHSGS